MTALIILVSLALIALYGALRMQINELETRVTKLELPFLRDDGKSMWGEK